MSQLRETFRLFAWFGQILSAFLRVKRGTTLAVIASSVIGRVTQLLAFILPLKIILLAASEGVPGYFQRFILLEDKAVWIAGLSGIAVTFYVVTLVLDAITKRLSRTGALEVLQGANEMAIVGNHREQAQDVFARVTQITARMLFGVAGLIAIAFLNGTLFVYLVGLFAAMFAFTAWALRNDDPVRRTSLAAFIRDNRGNYLRVLSSISFLSGFLVILYPFLMGVSVNTLVAIALIILMRQVFNALVEAINEGIRLAHRKQLVNTLVFRDHQLLPSEAREYRALRDVFKKNRRQQIVARALTGVLDVREPVEVHWSDAGGRGITVFVVAVMLKDASSRRLQLRVFSPRSAHLPENEELLFRHIPREKLHAPPLLARISEQSFACQICDSGQGELAPLDKWQAVQHSLNQDISICQPPAGLIDAYNASHPMMHDRLSEELIARLEVAVDNDAEAAILSRLQTLLPLICTQLARLPLQLINPDLTRDNVLVAAEGQFYIMNWGRWALEPIGVELAGRAGHKRLAAVLDIMRKSRTDIPANLKPDHLNLARKCRELENSIMQGRYKAALRVATKINELSVLREKQSV